MFEIACEWLESGTARVTVHHDIPGPDNPMHFYSPTILEARRSAEEWLVKWNEALAGIGRADLQPTVTGSVGSIKPRKSPAQERRFRMLHLSPELLLHIFGQWRKSRYVMVSAFEGVPEVAEIHDVGWDDDRMCFWLRISHESFERVPDGAPCPRVEQVYNQHSVTFTRIEDQFRRVEPSPGIYETQLTAAQTLGNLTEASEIYSRWASDPLWGIGSIGANLDALPTKSVKKEVLRDDPVPPEVPRESYVGLDGAVK